MEFRFVHFYPDLMSLYGSYANLCVLRRLLEQLGHTVTLTPLAPGERASLAEADLLFMGAGTERSQKAAMDSLAPLAGEIRSAASDGMPVFFAGTAMELLGAAITDSSGATFDGIALADFTSVQGTRRFVEDVYGTTDLYPEAVVGFMNKCSVIRGVQTPLLTALAMGFGNEGPRGSEGFHQANVFASELTGPLLVKNPRMLETVASVILSRRGAEIPAPFPRDPWAQEAYAVTEHQLQLRCKA